MNEETKFYCTCGAVLTYADCHRVGGELSAPYCTTGTIFDRRGVAVAGSPEKAIEARHQYRVVRRRVKPYDWLFYANGRECETFLVDDVREGKAYLRSVSIRAAGASLGPVSTCAVADLVDVRHLARARVLAALDAERLIPRVYYPTFLKPLREAQPSLQQAAKWRG